MATSGFGRFAINLSSATGGQDCLLGPDQRLTVRFVPHSAPRQAPRGQQIERAGILPCFQIRDAVHAFDHGAHHLAPVASPSACTMRSWLCPPSRPRAKPRIPHRMRAPQAINSSNACRASRTTISTTCSVAQVAAGGAACRIHGSRSGPPGRERRRCPLAHNCCSIAGCCPW